MNIMFHQKQERSYVTKLLTIKNYYINIEKQKWAYSLRLSDARRT